MNGKKIKCPLIIMAALSLACIIVACFCKNSIAQGFLVSFSSGIIASIIVIIMINQRLDKYAAAVAEKKEKSTERQAILNFDSVIQCMLPQYRLLFNQLTIPWSARSEEHRFLPIDNTHLNDFKLNDLADLFGTNITLYGTYGECSLEAYSHIYDQIMRSFENYLIMNTFNYYPTVFTSIKNILEVASIPNGMAALLEHYKKGNPDITKLITRMISSYDGLPYKDIEERKYNGNVMLLPLYLYLHLQRMKTTIQQYELEIQKIKDTQK